jgi:hypothetical protein
MLASIAVSGFGSSRRLRLLLLLRWLWLGAGGGGRSDGLGSLGRDSSRGATVVGEAGGWSGVRWLLIHGLLLLRLLPTIVLVIKGGGLGTLQVVVDISVPSPIKVSRVERRSTLVMVLGTRLCG